MDTAHEEAVDGQERREEPGDERDDEIPF